jgi:hypothetical protein
MSLLRVLVDGEPLPAEEGLAFWKRFSVWMDEHPGDLVGFAKSEDLASVHPEMHSGAPVLHGAETKTLRRGSRVVHAGASPVRRPRAIPARTRR